VRLGKKKLWATDNLDLNILMLFKWYLFKQRLSLIYFKIYNIFDFKVIYIVYLKFKQRKNKKLKAVYKKTVKRKKPKRKFKYFWNEFGLFKKKKKFLKSGIVRKLRSREKIHSIVVKRKTHNIPRYFLFKKYLNSWTLKFLSLGVFNLIKHSRVMIKKKKKKLKTKTFKKVVVKKRYGLWMEEKKKERLKKLGRTELPQKVMPMNHRAKNWFKIHKLLTITKDPYWARFLNRVKKYSSKNKRNVVSEPKTAKPAIIQNTALVQKKKMFVPYKNSLSPWQLIKSLSKQKKTKKKIIKKRLIGRYKRLKPKYTNRRLKNRRLVWRSNNFYKLKIIRDAFFNTYFNRVVNKFLKLKNNASSKVLLKKIELQKKNKINKQLYKEGWRLFLLKKKINQVRRNEIARSKKTTPALKLEEETLENQFFNINNYKTLRFKKKFPFMHEKKFFFFAAARALSAKLINIKGSEKKKNNDEEPNFNFFDFDLRLKKNKELTLKMKIKKDLDTSEFFKNMDKEGDMEEFFTYKSLLRSKIKLAKKKILLYPSKKRKKAKLKLKKIIVYYFFSKYFTKFYIKFQNIFKLNKFIPRLVKKYYSQFWYFKRNKNFYNLVTSLIFSKIFFSSYFLGFTIAKIFRARKNHGFVLKTISRMWQFFQFGLGLKINIKGKWWGSLRTKEKFILSERSVRQSESVMVDYFYYPVITKYGVFSIKMWLSELVWD